MKPLLYCLAATLPLWGQQCPPIISSTGSPTINCLATREFGQPQLRFPLTSQAPNLVEGRELSSPYSIAFDRSVTPPIVYVADTGNNRVLAWKNSSSLTQGNSADLVVGQVDMLSTNAQGPSQSSSTLPTGLYVPTGVAVDSSGNLYVADAGNNRILRYPAPFKQTLSPLQVDLVIGQANANSGSSVNQGQTTPGPATLYFCQLSNNACPNVVRTGMAFDSSGNLWVTDFGNNRVLRYPVSNLSSNNSLPAANLVLGQFDFVSNAPPSGAANQVQTNKLNTVGPLDLTFDQNGDLYVADSYSRVLFFMPPFSNGISALRVLGVAPTPGQGQPANTYPNQFSLGVFNASGQQVGGPPQCVVTIGNNLFVCDSGANRIVYYDVPANWPAATATQPSPPLIGSTIGQGSSFVTGTVNGGLPAPGGTGINGNALSSPFGAAFNGTELWIADTGNNRVLAFPQQSPLNFPAPTRVLGQTDFEYNGVNLVEGRGVNFFPAAQIVRIVASQAQTLVGAAVAVDTNSTPPHLYVADGQNNRVLGFKDANNILPGQTADIVIGQANFFSILPNWPNNGSSSGSHPQNPTATGLYNPSGVAVDANGNLLVADSGNGRVLRFPSPFSQPSGATQTANLVLGQTSFTQYDPTPRAQTMSTTYGLALFSDGSLAVSDALQNRVLIFQRPSGGDFTNGQAAAHVLGQPDFSTVTADSTLGKLNFPHQISVYNSAFFADELYVADTGNNRVVLYNNAKAIGNGPAASFVLNPGFNAPFSVVVNPVSGEIWVADTNNRTIDRFPAYQNLIGQTTVSAAQQIFSYLPLAMNFDAFGNLIVAEAANRVAFYYPQMVFRHEANFNTQSLVPGMLAHVGELLTTGFNLPVVPNPGVLPYPTVLSDVQLLMVGGPYVGSNPACPSIIPTTPAPLFGIDVNEQIHFQVPQCANTSGTQTFLVVRPSTGQIAGVGTFPMGAYNPGFFAVNSQGTGQVAANNSDHVSGNGPGNPDARGQEIVLYLTGAGFVPCSGLADGQVIPPGQVCPTPLRPKIAMVPGPAGFLPDSNINYSGLGAFVGGWQINVVIPASVPPGAVTVVVDMEGTPSNIGGGPNQGNSIGPDAGTNGIPPISTTIFVK